MIFAIIILLLEGYVVLSSIELDEPNYSAEGKYFDGTGFFILGENLDICDASWQSTLSIGRIYNSDDGGVTRGFLDCDRGTSSPMNCQFFMGDGMNGLFNVYSGLYIGVLMNEVYFIPIQTSDIELSDISFFYPSQLDYLVNETSSGQVRPSDCVVTTGASWSSQSTFTDSKGGKLYICVNLEEDNYSPNFGDQKGYFYGYYDSLDIQIYGRLGLRSLQVGSGHWFKSSTYDDDDENSSKKFGGMLIALGTGGSSSSLEMILYSGLNFSNPLTIDFTSSTTDSNSNNNICSSKKQNIFPESQQYSGCWNDITGITYHLMNLNGQFFGYFYSPQEMGVFEGSFNKFTKKATGSCYSVNHYYHFNSTFLVDFSGSSQTRVTNNCLSNYDPETILYFSSYYTTLWHSFASFGSSETQVIGNYYEGGSYQPFSTCQQVSKSNYAITSYNNLQGYMEGFFFDGLKKDISVSSFANTDIYGDESGIMIQRKMGPEGYYIQILRGVADSFNDENIEQVDYAGTFGMGEMYWDGPPSWSQCVRNTRFVPFSPFHKYNPPNPNPHTNQIDYDCWFTRLCLKIGKKKNQRRIYLSVDDGADNSIVPQQQDSSSINSIRGEREALFAEPQPPSDFLPPPSEIVEPPILPPQQYNSFGDMNNPPDEPVMIIGGYQSLQPISSSNHIESNNSYTEEPVSEDIKYEEFEGLRTRLKLVYQDGVNSEWQTVYMFIYNSEDEEFVMNRQMMFQNNLQRVSPTMYQSEMEEARKRFNWNQRNLSATLDSINSEISWKNVKWILVNE